MKLMFATNSMDGYHDFVNDDEVMLTLKSIQKLQQRQQNLYLKCIINLSI